jgi:hypothetical protein
MIVGSENRVTIARGLRPHPRQLTSKTWVFGGTHHGRQAACIQSIHMPELQSSYQVVKVEAGPETDDREITCRACGSPLAGREGKFVLPLEEGHPIAATGLSGSRHYAS